MQNKQESLLKRSHITNYGGVFILGAMDYWLGCYFPNPGLTCLKRQGGFKGDTVFLPSEANQIITRNSRGLSDKKLTVSLY